MQILLSDLPFSPLVLVGKTLYKKLRQLFHLYSLDSFIFSLYGFHDDRTAGSLFSHKKFFKKFYWRSLVNCYLIMRRACEKSKKRSN